MGKSNYFSSKSVFGQLISLIVVKKNIFMKCIILLLITLNLNVNAQTSTFKTGRISEAKLKIICENFGWKTDNVIILNFLQPKQNCHYNNYSKIKRSVSWWADFYAKMELKEAENKYVYSDSSAAKSIIDDITYFSDRNNFCSIPFFRILHTAAELF